MNTRPLMLASLFVATMLLGFAFYTAAILPDGALLPTHWNAVGEPDKFSSPLRALMLPPVMVGLSAVLFAVIPKIEPLQDRLEGSAPVLRAGWFGVVLLAIVIALTMGLPAYGVRLPVKTVFVGVGAFLVIVGNALPKSRPGFFVGIRTPWAIIDTDNWIATHRLGGRLMMLAGLVIIVAGILPLQAETTAIVLIAAVATSALVPFVYSWWLWYTRKQRS